MPSPHTLWALPELVAVKFSLGGFQVILSQERRLAVWTKSLDFVWIE
jgi:hypothetical protein